MSTYTGFVRFEHPGQPDTIEEIDVTATSLEHARERIQQELVNDYEPGGTIAHIEKRLGYFA